MIISHPLLRRTVPVTHIHLGPFEEFPLILWVTIIRSGKQAQWQLGFQKMIATLPPTSHD
jgi:hypothetical protein